MVLGRDVGVDRHQLAGIKYWKLQQQVSGLTGVTKDGANNGTDNGTDNGWALGTEDASTWHHGWLGAAWHGR